MKVYLFATLAAIIAGLVQAVTGFGGALTMMMVLPYLMPMKTAAALSGVTCVPMCIAIVLHYKASISFKKTVLPTAIYLVSSTICIQIASRMELDSLKTTFGLLLIGIAVYFSIFSGKLQINDHIGTTILFSAISGATGGLFGIGGPMLALYFLAVTRNKSEYLGTINFVFSIVETYSALIRFMNGLLTSSMVGLIVVCFVAMLAGRQIGSEIADSIDSEKMRKYVYILLGLSGLMTFIRSI